MSPVRHKHPLPSGEGWGDSTARDLSCRKGFQALWRFIRTLSMDDAYERYLAHHRAAHASTTPLDRRAFYLREQQRKWSGVSRCC